MIVRLTGRHALPAVLAVMALAACAGRAPVASETGDTACPDLTGSYCANGLLWEEGNTELEEAYLPYYLGIESLPGWDTVDRVDIHGVNEGLLTLTLHAGESVFASAEILAPDFICGNARVALKMDAIPWGGAGVILAFGGSGGWRLIHRGDDGILRVEQQRRETGTVFLVIPLSFRSDSWMQFRPVSDTGC